MQVILTQDIEKIGKLGDIVKVKGGFARNFLIPKGMAKPQTPENLKAVENIKRKIQKAKERKLAAAKEFAERLSKTSCTVAVQAGPDDKLYGAVTPADIQKALEAEGIQIDKKAVSIDEAIEKLGVYHVSVKVHPEVTAGCKVWVVEK